MATGLLVLGVGQGTRLLTYLVGLDKTYRARIRLGRATTTDDREGEPLGEAVDATALAEDEIERSLTALRGDIEQVPSTVSAIKVDGRRAYARARAGEDVELAARRVRISRFVVTGRRTDGPYLDLDAEIDCSSGTYVRALARDLRAAHGRGGHPTARRRPAVGPHPAPGGPPLPGLAPTAARVPPPLLGDEEQSAALGNGRRIRSEDGEPAVPAPLPEHAASAGDRPVAALDAAGRLIAIVAREGASWRPLLVVPVDARC